LGREGPNSTRARERVPYAKVAKVSQKSQKDIREKGKTNPGFGCLFANLSPGLLLQLLRTVSAPVPEFQW
jgi:hypothetical protein